MPINKTTQLTATVIEYPYLEKEFPTPIPLPLVIESAIYYDPDMPQSSIDVEPFLSKLNLNNQLSFIVENDLFGGNRNDPAPGKVKELKLTYFYNGIRSTLVCKEKATVILQGY